MRNTKRLLSLTTLLSLCCSGAAQTQAVVGFGGTALPAGHLAVAHHPGVGQNGGDIGFFRRAGVQALDLFIDGSLSPAPPAVASLRFPLPEAATYNPDLDEVWVAFDSGDVFAIDASSRVRQLPSLPSGILASGGMVFVPAGANRGVWAHVASDLYAFVAGAWQQVVSGTTGSGRLNWYPPTNELILENPSGGLAQHLDPITNSVRGLSGVITPPFAAIPAFEVLWSFQGSAHATLPGRASSTRTLINRESPTIFVVSRNRESYIVDGEVIRIWSANFARNPVLVRPGIHGRSGAFGTGCAPVTVSGARPRLSERITNNDGPNPGRTVLFRFDDLLPTAPIFLLVGFSRLNVPLGSGAPGCDLLTSVALSQTIGMSGPIGGPAVTTIGPIPNSVPLGTMFYAQGGQLVPGANPLGLALTNGLELTVGNRW